MAGIDRGAVRGWETRRVEDVLDRDELARERAFQSPHGFDGRSIVANRRESLQAAVLRADARQRLRDGGFEVHGDTRRVVYGAVINLVAVLCFADSEVIPVRCEDHILIGLFGSLENADDVLRIDSPDLVLYFNGSLDSKWHGFEIRLKRSLFHVVEIETGRFE